MTKDEVTPKAGKQIAFFNSLPVDHHNLEDARSFGSPTRQD